MARLLTAMKTGHNFQDEKNRLEVTNRILFLELVIYYIVVSVFSAYKYANHQFGIIPVIVIIASIVSAIISVLIYIRERCSKKFSANALTLYFAVYLFALVWEDLQMTLFTSIVILSALVVFYNRARISVYSAITAFCGIFNYIYQIAIAKTSSVEDLSMTGNLLVFLAAIYGVYRTTIRGIAFNEDIIGAIRSEQKAQGEMLEEVLEIANVVKENANASSELVRKLGESTRVTKQTVNEISLSTQSTAESVQTQTVMTQQIQQSIEETVGISREMVGSAEESSESIHNGLDVMNNLKEHSNEIASNNKDVESSMQSLMEKTQSVQEIADIITGISSQTNLLALNASIEAARAGEMGKGFAVVADEIRKLANQTKQSTDSIYQIITELKDQAELTVSNVSKSIKATDRQEELIDTVAELFNSINANVNQLAENVSVISDKLSNLQDANNNIVEHISQISATTEEVSASSEEAATISEENYKHVEDVVTMLQDVLETLHRLDRYIKK